MLYEELLGKLGLLDQPVRCFEQVMREEPALNRRDLGVMPVPVDRIVGSVSRCKDVSVNFLPRHKSRGRLDRLNGVRQAMKRDSILPPVELYRLRDEYYVVDGHHRVAVAKEMDMAYLDAHVTDLLPLGDTPANALALARSSFALATGLHNVELTQAEGYHKLLAHIAEHQSGLAQHGARSVPVMEAAQDWYRTTYVPILRELQDELAEGTVARQFPGKTLGDLYLLLAEYKWLESERQGHDIGLHQAMVNLQMASDGHGWLRQLVDTVVPCQLMGSCPLQVK